jgi:hypothetical protein
MRHLKEIISDLKDGKEPSYRELKYAVLALQSLLYFDSNAIRRLAENEQKGNFDSSVFGASFQEEESYRRHSIAMNKSPQEWLGWENDPENPEYPERVQKMKTIFSNIVKKIEEKKRI